MEERDKWSSCRGGVGNKGGGDTEDVVSTSITGVLDTCKDPQSSGNVRDLHPSNSVEIFARQNGVATLQKFINIEKQLSRHHLGLHQHLKKPSRDIPDNQNVSRNETSYECSSHGGKSLVPANSNCSHCSNRDSECVHPHCCDRPSLSATRTTPNKPKFIQPDLNHKSVVNEPENLSISHPQNQLLFAQQNHKHQLKQVQMPQRKRSNYYQDKHGEEQRAFPRKCLSDELGLRSIEERNIEDNEVNQIISSEYNNTPTKLNPGFNCNVLNLSTSNKNQDVEQHCSNDQVESSVMCAPPPSARDQQIFVSTTPTYLSDFTSDVYSNSTATSSTHVHQHLPQHFTLKMSRSDSKPCIVSPSLQNIDSKTDLDPSLLFSDYNYKIVPYDSDEIDKLVCGLYPPQTTFHYHHHDNRDDGESCTISTNFIVSEVKSSSDVSDSIVVPGRNPKYIQCTAKSKKSGSLSSLSSSGSNSSYENRPGWPHVVSAKNTNSQEYHSVSQPSCSTTNVDLGIMETVSGKTFVPSRNCRSDIDGSQGLPISTSISSNVSSKPPSGLSIKKRAPILKHQSTDNVWKDASTLDSCVSNGGSVNTEHQQRCNRFSDGLQNVSSSCSFVQSDSSVNVPIQTVDNSNVIYANYPMLGRNQFSDNNGGSYYSYTDDSQQQHQHFHHHVHYNYNPFQPAEAFSRYHQYHPHRHQTPYRTPSTSTHFLTSLPSWYSNFNSRLNYNNLLSRNYSGIPPCARSVSSGRMSDVNISPNVLLSSGYMGTVVANSATPNVVLVNGYSDVPVRNHLGGTTDLSNLMLLNEFRYDGAAAPNVVAAPPPQGCMVSWCSPPNRLLSNLVCGFFQS